MDTIKEAIRERLEQIDHEVLFSDLDVIDALKAKTQILKDTLDFLKEQGNVLQKQIEAIKAGRLATNVETVSR